MTPGQCVCGRWLPGEGQAPRCTKPGSTACRVRQDAATERARLYPPLRLGPDREAVIVLPEDVTPAELDAFERIVGPWLNFVRTVVEIER